LSEVKEELEKSSAQASKLKQEVRLLSVLKSIEEKATLESLLLNEILSAQKQRSRK